MSGIFTMFVAGLGCFAITVPCAFNDNWWATIGWAVAGLFAWIIAIMRIIQNQQEMEKDNVYYSDNKQ